MGYSTPKHIKVDRQLSGKRYLHMRSDTLYDIRRVGSRYCANICVYMVLICLIYVSFAVAHAHILQMGSGLTQSERYYTQFTLVIYLERRIQANGHRTPTPDYVYCQYNQSIEFEGCYNCKWHLTTCNVPKRVFIDVFQENEDVFQWLSTSRGTPGAFGLRRMAVGSPPTPRIYALRRQMSPQVTQIHTACARGIWCDRTPPAVDKAWVCYEYLQGCIYYHHPTYDHTQYQPYCKHNAEYCANIVCKDCRRYVFNIIYYDTILDSRQFVRAGPTVGDASDMRWHSGAASPVPHYFDYDGLHQMAPQATYMPTHCSRCHRCQQASPPFGAARTHYIKYIPVYDITQYTMDYNYLICINHRCNFSIVCKMDINAHVRYNIHYTTYCVSYSDVNDAHPNVRVRNWCVPDDVIYVYLMLLSMLLQTIVQCGPGRLSITYPGWKTQYADILTPAWAPQHKAPYTGKQRTPIRTSADDWMPSLHAYLAAYHETPDVIQANHTVSICIHQECMDHVTIRRHFVCCNVPLAHALIRCYYFGYAIVCVEGFVLTDKLWEICDCRKHFNDGYSHTIY